MNGRPSPNGRTVVVGLGNVLTGDDALGPTAVALFQAAWHTHPDVEVVDAGTPGMDLAALLADAGAVVVVDTVQGADPPGTVKRYSRAALLGRPLQPRTNPHAPGLAETLLSLELLGLGPGPVTLIGVVPRAVEVGRGLSPQVERALPTVLEAVADELERLGHELHRRPEPLPPDLWWRRSPALASTPPAPPAPPTAGPSHA